MIRQLGGIVLTFATVAVGQVPQYALKSVGEKETSQQAGNILVPVKCDANGNIYVRSAHGPGLKAFTRSVTRIKPDGQARLISLDSSPELKDLDAYDFAISPDGSVFFTAAAPHAVYVVEFDNEGKFKSKTKLDHVFQPKHLAVFRDGSFLVAGIELPQGDDLRPKAFTAVFDASGKTVKIVTLPNGRKETSPGGDEAIEAAREELMFGTVLTGEDGNAYVLRHTAPAQIYVVSPSGSLVRTIKVRAPMNGMLPDAIHLSNGRTLVTFSDDRQAMFKLVNSQTGEAIAEYTTTGEIGAAVGCYDGRQFTLLSSKNKHLSLVEAVP